MPEGKKKHRKPGLPTDELYSDDGKPGHDNPHHAGVHSHQCRSFFDLEEVYPIHARPQCAYVKSMKRN